MKKPNFPFLFTPFAKNAAIPSTLYYKEEKYRAIVENSAHAFILSVTDGLILETNYAATIMFGYSPDEFKFLKRWDIVDHNDPNLLLAVQQRERTGFAMTEATAIKKNGDHFPVEISSSIFIDSNGQSRTSTMISDISMRKKAEAAMRLSNERFDLVVKATNDLVWDWDLVTGEIYRSGSGLTDVYGHKTNESIKDFQSWADHLHPQDKDKINQQIAYYINSQEETAFSFEYRFRREDDTYAYISDKGYIIRNEQGKVIRMIGAAEDITERKKTALAIEESEQRYKLFVTQSTEGIWRIELTEPIDITAPLEEMIENCFNKAFIAECNDAYAQMYGFTKAAELIGIPLHKLWPKDNAVSIEYITGFFKNGFKATEEISHEYNRNGEQVIFLNSMLGIVEDNFLIRVWGTRRNITDQKKAEALLLVSEERYRYLFNNNPASIMIWDIETLEIIEVNETAVKLYGYTWNEFLQLSILDLRPKADHPKFLKFVQQFKQNEISKKTMTWHHLNNKAAGIIMEISSHSITYNGRNAVLALGNNITEKIRLENSLNEEREIRQQQITEAVIGGQEKERTELGEELHDNINQILASTKLYIECALKDKDPRKDLIAESKLLIEKAMTEIRSLSKSLLPPSLGEVGLLQGLHELAGDIMQVNELAISIDWQDLDENELCDKLKLTIFRIVQEQLNNIIKHAHATDVSISVKRSGDMIQVSIKDNGRGFNTALKRNGVGLRNIISRAEVNHGVVIIDSKPGAGCELLVNFTTTTLRTKLLN